MKNLKLLLIAAVLVAIALAIQPSGKPGSAVDANIGHSLVVAEEIDGIAEIFLNAAQGQISLKQASATWRLPELHSLRADPNRVEELFQRLTAAKIVESVSANAAKHADLGVASLANDAPPTGPDSAILVFKNKSGGEIKRVYLGKGRQSRMVDGSQGFGNDGQYCRFNADNNVYLLSTFMWLEKNAKNWLGKDLLKINPEKISKLSWSYSGSEKNTFVLARNAASDSLVLDKLQNGQQTKQAAVAAITSLFSGLAFDDFIATSTPAQHPALADRLELALESFDGLKFKILISSGTVELPGSGNMHLLWLNGEYAGADTSLQALVKELNGNSEKLAFAVQPQRIKALMVKAADLSEPEPPKPTPPSSASATVPVVSQPVLPAVENAATSSQPVLLASETLSVASETVPALVASESAN